MEINNCYKLGICFLESWFLIIYQYISNYIFLWFTCCIMIDILLIISFVDYYELKEIDYMIRSFCIF